MNIDQNLNNRIEQAIETYLRDHDHVGVEATAPLATLVMGVITGRLNENTMRIPLDENNPSMGEYSVIQNDGRYRWEWFSPCEESDNSQDFDTLNECLDDLSNDITENLAGPWVTRMLDRIKELRETGAKS